MSRRGTRAAHRLSKVTDAYAARTPSPPTSEQDADLLTVICTMPIVLIRT
ncbi:hypothetical protein JOF44_003537 [Brachybacterium fresconis]|uniref:Uncharacterized protein n=1 Tax=Brachybacterium fresconis TaxID=173363 RepID=A0ABS4YPA7_9MICO|nr:hypothetical protein [Brachybacterium fresconis]